MLQTEPPGQNQSAQEWSCSSHRESIVKALSSPGIRANKKTHINCGSSARMAGNVCANVDQIRRQGRWNNTTINGAYLTNFPRELVRSMAGFPTYGRFFYLAHAALNPPTSLCKKLFRAIGEWHDRLAAKELSFGDHIQPTVAENAFVQVIMMFRKTLIQDSVLMMELHPCYPIWQHSIFSDPAYLSGICCKLKLRNTILPTHSSNNVCLCTLDFKPRLAIRLFFCPSYYFARGGVVVKTAPGVVKTVGSNPTTPPATTYLVSSSKVYCLRFNAV
ncbi:hypothetical protein [Absidia glauca]|uniref:Ndc10 domain-containing protein n=1 Tax=Absidia glauca TaxID=4829 RepID=A0A163JYB6_ABSGL|nr:hypothetical protein [Absidia glauca]